MLIHAHSQEYLRRDASLSDQVLRLASSQREPASIRQQRRAFAFGPVQVERRLRQVERMQDGDGCGRTRALL